MEGSMGRRKDGWKDKFAKSIHKDRRIKCDFSEGHMW